MTEREERVKAAADSLRHAVLEMPPGERPANRLLPEVDWRAIGKACITNWIDDAERSCTRIARALERVDAEGDTEDARDEIETALWRITATREKLEAVFALSFGVPSLAPYKGTSSRFEPSTDGIRAKLRELAQTQPAAQELAEIGKRLAEHPGVTLRDQLSHQLAAITEATELCWIDVAHLSSDGIIGWTGGPFYGENVLDGGAITRDALWTRAVTWVEECFESLVRSFELMGGLVGQAAVLEPPQRVYRDGDTGEIAFTDPRAGA